MIKTFFLEVFGCVFFQQSQKDIFPDFSSSVILRPMRIASFWSSFGQCPLRCVDPGISYRFLELKRTILTNMIESIFRLL